MMIDYFAQGCKDWNIPINDIQLQQIDRFGSFLKQKAQVMNLTTLLEDREMALKLFLDSLCPPALENIPLNSRIIDVGTGAGSPGLILAICRPDLKVTLLDSLAKRIGFLDEAIELIGLQNANTVWGRAEDIAKDPYYRETYDVATARAVAALPVLAEYLLPFVLIGGKLLAYKGARAQEEMRDSTFAIKQLGGKNTRLQNYSNPYDLSNMSIVISDKIRHTPAIYPRKPGIATRNPLLPKNPQA